MVDYINHVPGVPLAIGPYSQAALHAGLVFLSGQIALNPETGEITGDIVSQTEQTLSNIKNVLNHLGLGFENVLKSTIFLVDMKDFEQVNQIYEKWLGTSKPARSTVQVAALPKAALVEIEMIAHNS